LLKSYCHANWNEDLFSFLKHKTKQKLGRIFQERSDEYV